jgi:hypothetical protein
MIADEREYVQKDSVLVGIAVHSEPDVAQGRQSLTGVQRAPVLQSQLDLCCSEVGLGELDRRAATPPPRAAFTHRLARPDTAPIDGVVRRKKASFLRYSRKWTSGSGGC